MTQEEGIKRIYDLIAKYDLEMPYSESPERNRLKLAQDIWQLINAYVAEVIGKDEDCTHPLGHPDWLSHIAINKTKAVQRERAGLTEGEK